MPPRLQFVVMSSGEDDRVLAQLIDALAPQPVLIHQDAGRPRARPMSLQRRGVRWVTPPLRTGWGDWGFASAILRSVADAMTHHEFDYLQLLSPSCLPIRPVADLIEHVRTSPADYHADVFELGRDRDTRMTFAWRALAPAYSLRQRALRRARHWYFGARPALEQSQSMSLFHRRTAVRGWGGVRAGAAVAFTDWICQSRRVSQSSVGSPNQGEIAVGSVWFGARREVCARMLEIASQPEVSRVFQPLSMVDELLIPSLLMRAGRAAGPSNHAISVFDLQGHPARIDQAQLELAGASGRYFARKFAPVADDPCRHLALRWTGCEANEGVDAVSSEARVSDDPLSEARPGSPGFRSSPDSVRTG